MLLPVIFSLFFALPISATVPWSAAPYLVEIYDFNQFVCIGTLVDDYTVLSAASCFDHDIHPSSFVISNFRSFRSYVKSLSLHPYHHQDHSCFFDIAVLALRSKFHEFSPENTLSIGTRVKKNSTLVTAHVSPSPRRVHKPVFKLGTNKYCSGSNWYLCAERIAGDDFCKQCSGGPLINSDTNEVVGVNSKDDCQFGKLTGFTKLGDQEWIQEHTWRPTKPRSGRRRSNGRGSDKHANKHKHKDRKDKDHEIQFKSPKKKHRGLLRGLWKLGGDIIKAKGEFLADLLA